MNSIRRPASACFGAPGSLLTRFGLMIAVMFLVTTVPAHAQQLTGTLSATAYDTTGAVIPGATVTLKNSESGDLRKTVTDGSGYFTFTAVQPATYTISISAKGFTTWQLSGIVMDLGASKTIPNIALKAGSEGTTVEVVADKNVEVPMDTPEISNTLTANQIEDLSLGGRDAGELLKMMPGAAFTSGGTQGSMFNPQVTGTNSGPVGNYSLNGTQPYGAMAYMLDGANLVDPGNAGTQIANINEDMVQEVKVLTGSYGAEYAYGPVIFEAFSKSGGKNLHGEGYLYSRNSTLNSWESYAKETYLSDIASASGAAQAASLASIGYPYEYFYYMGGNVGGPVVLPFVNFNKNHDKLFFWGGYEYMIQHPNQNVAYYNEPTADQRNGIFDCGGSYGGGAQTNKYNGVPSLCGSTDEFEALESADPTIGYAYYQPAQRTAPGGAVVAQDANWTQDASGNLHIPTTDLDPNITTLVSKAYPVPNLTANANNGWSNYAFSPSIPQNRWEATGKLDYAISDNTKLSGTYAYQSEVDQHPITIWWAPPNTLPYPTPVQADVNAQVILGNFTHQFNATTTNEAVFTLSRFINPNTTSNNTRSLEGMSGITGLFGHTSTQMPNINNSAWGEALSSIDQEPFDGGFAGNGFGKLARVPQFYDTVSKVIGSHTAKAGFYWSQPYNSQSSGSDDGGEDQGQFNIGWPANYGTGNITADFLLGTVGSYEQLSGVPLDDIKMNNWAIWAQDSWKANKQLTLNLGLRLDHVGQWYGEPAGNQVWVQSDYVDANPAPANTGLEWNATNKNVPLSGFSSALFYPDPRIGLIYDLFGTGRTVLRAGFGSYHYQDSVNEATTENVADGPKGVINFSSPTSFIGYANADTSGTPPTSVQESCWLCGNSVGGDLLGDNRTPNTLDWNVSIDQATKWQSLVEISYVGNHTTGEEFNGVNGNINNLNNVPIDALFAAKDPITGATCSASAVSGATGCTDNDFRPMHNYTNVYLLTHQSYEKYNSLQASWRKNGAKLNFQANYTFSKVMGIWDGDTSNGSGNGTTVWPYLLGDNYGPLDYDHTHIFNIWYIYNLPSPIHGNRLLGEVINDWKMSGYNTYQAGASMQANIPNMNASYPSANAGLFTMPNGQLAQGQTTSSWLGTNSVNDLMPLLTCNPAKGLSSGQHFNPNCFAAPSVGPYKDSAGVIHPGVEGPLHWPYLRYPGYLDNDLSIFKSFPTTESQRFELRVQAQNFVNHPNPQFDLDGNNDDIQVGFKTLGGANTDTGVTGKPFHTTGQRLMMFSGKYYF